MQYFLFTPITNCININKAQLLSAFPSLAVIVSLHFSLLDDEVLLGSGLNGPGTSGKTYIFRLFQRVLRFALQ